MPLRCTVLLALLAFSLSVPAASADDAKEQQKADEAFLDKLGFKTDGPALVEFFKKRTLSKEDVQKLADTVEHSDGSNHDLVLAMQVVQRRSSGPVCFTWPDMQ